MLPTFIFLSPNVVVYQQKLTTTILLSFSDNSPIGFNPPSFELRQSYDLATSFRIDQVMSNQDHPRQLVHRTYIRLSSSYNKTDLYFYPSQIPNAFISPKTLSSYRYVCLFIAFQDIHPSSMADPYSQLPILVFVPFVLRHPTSGFCGLSLQR